LPSFGGDGRQAWIYGPLDLDRVGLERLTSELLTVLFGASISELNELVVSADGAARLLTVQFELTVGDATAAARMADAIDQVIADAGASC